MMGKLAVFVVVALVVCGVAVDAGDKCVEREPPPPAFLDVTFDDDAVNPHKISGTPYDFAFEGDMKERNFETGVNKEALQFNGNFFLRVGQGKLGPQCVSNVDMCEEGFTFTVWFKPDNPWMGTDPLEYLVSFGRAEEQEFGFSVALRRTILQIRVQGATRWHQVECEISPLINKNSWKFLVVKMPNIDTEKELVVLINNERLTCTDLPGQPKEDPETELDITNELVIGAKYFDDNGFEGYKGRYHGGLDDLRFFEEELTSYQITTLWQKGKDAVASRELHQRNLVEKLAEKLKSLI